MCIKKLIIIFILPIVMFSQIVTYEKISPKNTFMLVIDKSGSMSVGDAIGYTIKGAKKFVSQMKKGDQTGLITFNGGIDIDVSITPDTSALIRAINDISVEGATKLYDALASGVQQLITDSNRRIIVYLTDGRDTGSVFRISNLESMFQGENIFIYGIGVGDDVNVDALKKISDITGGKFHTISDNNKSRLSTIYSDVLSSIYKSNSKNIEEGDLIVGSIPNGNIVKVGGVNKGLTPLKLVGLPPGYVSVDVHFDYDRIWQEKIMIKKGKTASIRAREQDAMKNLWISSKPHGASVFIDGEYVGVTSYEIVDITRENWHKDIMNSPKELEVIGLKPGFHRIEVIGFPDFDYGPEQKFVIDYIFKNDDVIVVDILNNMIKNKNGDEIIGQARKDPFDF